MAPASSEEEEQGNEEADSMVAPAAPERQEDVDSTVDEGTKKLIEEAAMGCHRKRPRREMQVASSQWTWTGSDDHQPHFMTLLMATTH